MQCEAVTDLLLGGEHLQGAAEDAEQELEQHLATCARCAHMASGLARVDRILRSSLVVEPPPVLQDSLLQLALEAAQPARPWWSRLLGLPPDWSLSSWLSARPNVVAAQGLAAVMLALATWQVFGWLTAFQPVIGDVAYAMELVVSSPAAVYLGGLQIDLQSLGVWSLVGLVGWLISENGLIGRRFRGLRLP